MVLSNPSLSRAWVPNKVLVLATAILFFVSGVLAGPRPATCRLKPLWVDDTGLRSSNYGFLGAFSVSGEEGQTVKAFRDDDSGLVINVGVRFEDDYSKRPQRPYLVWLAVRVSNKEEKAVFERAESSEAFADDKKGWKLSVRQSGHVKDKLYMYTLTCEQQKN